MSFINPTTVPMSFQGGLMNKVDALQLQAPALLGLENGLFDKIGQLNKRPGYDILSNKIMGGGQITSAVAIDNYLLELNLFDNLNIYTYIESIKSWASRGTAISLINTSSRIITRDDAQQINPDSCFLDNIQVFVWEDSRGGVRYSVIDFITGSYPVSDQVLYGLGANPKCVAFNGLIFVFYTDQLNNLFYKTINPNNPAILTSQLPISGDNAVGFVFDVAVSSNGIYIAVGASAGLDAYFLDINQIKTGGATADRHPGIACLSIVLTLGGAVWISYAINNPALYNTGMPSGFVSSLLFSSALSFQHIIAVDSLTSGVVNIAGIESVASPGSLQLIYEAIGQGPFSASNQFVKTAVVNQNTTFLIVGPSLSLGIATKPFIYNNNIFINLTYQSPLQSTYFTAFLTDYPFTIVGKVGAQVGGGLRTNGMVAECPTISDGIFLFINLVKGQFISEDNTSFSLLGVNSTIINFNNPNKFNSVTSSNNLLFVGGILQSYDGIAVAEQNFHLFPENIQATVFPYGGALSVGQYQYQVVYAWTDRFGQIQYSGTSIPITVTVTVANSSVILEIDTLRLTSKTGVIIKIYRTQVNQTTFQEVTSELAPLLNKINVNYVLFTDEVADIDIAGNQTIYTTGGIVSNAAPPSCSMIVIYQDRVMVAGTEDGSQIWFSKNKVNNSNYNTIPVEFSSSLTIGVSQVGGPITALAIMDQNLIIFKESVILVLNGDGPNDEDGGDTFADPQIITKSSGCTNPNSILFTDAGLIYQTPHKGLFLLPRSLAAPSYIGAGVDDIALTNVVSSSTLDQNKNLAIFTTLQGLTMVYDTIISQWSTWTNHEAIDSIVYNGTFTFVKENGNVYVQNPNNFFDGVIDGYQIPYNLNVITPWISYSQVLGYQSIFRIFLLGTYKSPHTLSVSVGYNFNSAFTAAGVINATNTNTWGSDGYWGDSTPWGGVWQPYIFQINMPIQKCTSFRFQFNDIQTAPYLEAFAVSSLLFELGQMPQGVRIPVTNKIGVQ